jgi:CO dehydrogenase/acetyl-CoA synthase epsilon subunit
MNAPNPFRVSPYRGVPSEQIFSAIGRTYDSIYEDRVKADKLMLKAKSEADPTLKAKYMKKAKKAKLILGGEVDAVKRASEELKKRGEKFHMK